MNVLEEIYRKMYAEREVILEEKEVMSASYTTFSGPSDVKILFADSGIKVAPDSHKTTLVVPDAHCGPNQDISRFSSLGNLITEKKPDNIVLMGDFVTLESLSAWDLGKAGKMEGKRYSEDCKSGIAAIHLMLSPLRRLQARQKKAGEEVYKPRLVYCLGNHCLDKETELLTQDGWIKYTEIKKDYHKVFSLNPSSGLGEWVEIEDSIYFKFDGKLNRVQNNTIDLLCTDDHGIFTLDQNRKKYKKEPFSEINNSSRRYIINAASEGKNIDFDISDDMLKLIGWILTDGHINKKDRSISIYQRPQKMPIIENIVNNLKLDYSLSYRDREISEICGVKLKNTPQSQGTLRFKINSFKEILNFIDHDKSLPSWISSLSDRQFRILLNSLIDGDSSRHKSAPESFLVLCGKKEFIEKMFIHLITRGYRSHIYTYREDQYRLNITTRNFSTFEKNQKTFTREDYTGDVWDLTVKHGNFMIRRNNKCHFTGNCDRLDRYLATRPELDAHLDIVKDLELAESGFTDIVPYRAFIELEGTLFTHAVMNAANLAIGGKTALAVISQAVSKSVVIGHLHRFETINVTRHGAEDIIQIVSSGCFFDGVEDYADGGLNAYFRGVMLLTHWKKGRFDIETISTDRLMELY